MRFGALFFTMLVAGLTVASSVPAGAETVESVIAANTQLTPDAINSAPLVEVDSVIAGGTVSASSGERSQEQNVIAPSAAIARLQILLDRAGASPGVIDGLYGSNLRKAVAGFQLMRGFAVDGKVNAELASALETADPVIGSYEITADDLGSVIGDLPKDYRELAKMDHLGYQTAEEGIAERFHTDVDFLRVLNPGSDFAEGQTIFVAAFGPDREGQVTKVEVDKDKGQVRAYADDRSLVAVYPASIGSQSNPSPSGTHIVKAVVENPTYTYNPHLNFQQGKNDKVLTLPPGPNNPVGSVWIDLSEPTYGIHGTPDPDLIDKTGSHGCVRLTNWDAQELGKMLTKGVPVAFK